MRLFFAIDLPPALRTNIDHWRNSRFPGIPEATPNLHITLVFLGEIHSTHLDQIREIGARADFTPFTLRLDRVRRWRNGILHLAPSRTPPALLALQRSVQDGVGALGIPTERRRYSPHLTLARECPEVERLGRCPTFVWPVDKLTLFSSERTREGVLFYRAVGEWPARERDRPQEDELGASNG